MPSTLRHVLDVLERALGHLAYYPYLGRYWLTRGRSRLLHVGCGRNRFEGWINADVTPRADLIVYLERRLPFPDSYLDRVYSEHVLEHVPYETGVAFLREAYRVLRPGGVVRVAMPDLEDLVDAYVADWRRLDWVHWPGHEAIRSRAKMLNAAFRWWGHQHLYDREEIRAALAEAGFTRVADVRPGESAYPELCRRETRADTRLVVEAIK